MEYTMSSKPAVDLKSVMQTAADSGILVPAFNAPYLPMMKPIAEALGECGTFGLIETARLEFVKFGAKGVKEASAAYNEVAIPGITSLHLDHTPVIDEDGVLVDYRGTIGDAIDHGYSSVMVDGSRLPFEENIAATAGVVAMAHPKGVQVEAELGAVLGHEAGPLPPYEELFASRRGFTDPDQAKEFAQKSGVDWLSVAVGSIHGAISEAARDKAKVQAKLDIEQVKRLRAATGLPLVLHGGSGIQMEYVRQAIKNGVVKINIGTDIRQPYERVLKEAGSVEAAQDAVRELIIRMIREVYCIEGSAKTLVG